MRLSSSALALSLIALLCSCGGIYRLSVSPPEQFTEAYVSPDVGCHQGYATDGTTHFIFDTKRILARSNAPSWPIVRVNDTPFAGLANYNHLGDGDYFDGKLYVPGEQYASCDNDRDPAIFVFDSNTLVRLSAVPLDGNEEVSGVAVRPEKRELWVSSYCDATRLWIYDLDSMTFLRTISLRPTVSKIQGLAYRAGAFYLAQNTGSIRKMYLDGTSVEVFHTDSPGAHEGVDYSQVELRWLIDGGLGQQRIHFLVRH